MASANAPDNHWWPRMNKLNATPLKSAQAKPNENTESMSELYGALFSEINHIQQASRPDQVRGKNLMQLLKSAAKHHSDPNMTPGDLLVRAIAEIKSRASKVTGDYSAFDKQTSIPLFAVYH